MKKRDRYRPTARQTVPEKYVRRVGQAARGIWDNR